MRPAAVDRSGTFPTVDSVIWRARERL